MSDRPELALELVESFELPACAACPPGGLCADCTTLVDMLARERGANVVVISQQSL